MNKILANLISGKFSVYVGGEFERMTDFLGFISLIENYSDFFQYERYEQFKYLKGIVDTKYAYVDANIYVKVGK